MLFDWIAREGWIVLNWWLLITLAGAAIFPLCLCLLKGLPDSGYTFARAAGLLMVAFTFWLLATLGFLRNTPGSIVLSWLVVLVVSLTMYARNRGHISLREWWRSNRSVVMVAEALFIVLLFGWAIVRAHQPELRTTEKPMDLAFMSASQRSEVYPPNDPWMSGYAISYYYFGYVISAVLAKMSGVPSTTGFNMNIVMLFALTGLTSFGVIFNLIRSRVAISSVAQNRPVAKTVDTSSTHRLALVLGLLGAVFVVLLGNFQTVVVELPYQAHLVSEDYLRFWDTKNRDTYEGRETPVDIFDPRDPSYWWWFSASRVVTERDLNGNRVNEVIDEFPQFSFVLADSHPHVMALPYAVLAVGLALNLLLTGRDPIRAEVLFYGLCIGALVFLNTWDNPIYIALAAGADAIRRMMRSGRGRLLMDDWVGLIKLVVALAAIAVVAYLPFLLSFRSQLAGLLPNVLFPTRPQQYFLVFGPFIFILAAFLAVEAWRGARNARMNWMLGLWVSLVFLAIFCLLLIGLTALGWLLSPELKSVALSFVDQSGGWAAVLPAILARRLGYGLVTSLILLAGIALGAGRLFPRLRKGWWDEETENRQVVTYPAATGFALLLVALGLALTFIPEYVYLRDNFGWRMNTVFKFYYQAWVVFSVAGVYAIYTIFFDETLILPRPAIRKVLGVIVVAGIAAGMVYPILAVYNRMFIENPHRLLSESPPPLTLDGGRTMVSFDDYTVILCLDKLVEGTNAVVAEAVGPAYHSDFGRVGALTGIPIVLGWENHEGQWRGATYPQIVGTRVQDIRTLYTDVRWDAVQPIIQRYGIDFILFGDSERSQYGPAGEDKFIENVDVVCEQGNSRVFRIDAVETGQG